MPSTQAQGAAGPEPPSRPSRCDEQLGDLGPRGQNPLLTIWSLITGSHLVIFPPPQSSQARAFVEFLKMRMGAGELRAVIDRAYPLEAIAEAYRYVVTEQKTGIVVITVRIG